MALKVFLYGKGTKPGVKGACEELEEWITRQESLEVVGTDLTLSREMAEISTKHRAQAVVVGSYAVASNRVYLTARVINVNDGRVLSSYDYNIPIGRNTFKMLLKGKDSLDWL